MRVNRFLVPGLLVAALLGTALVAQAAGLWSTSGRDAVDVTHMTPADIKGWMTLQQVIDGEGVSQAELYALAGVPADVSTSTALKDMEALVPDFSVETLRENLTAWAAGPAEAGGEPAPVGTIVTSTAAPTPTPDAAALAEPTATPTHVPGSSAGTGTEPTPLPAGQILPANQIKGKMTLEQVSQQCAVPLEALLKELGLPAATNPDTAIKDLVSQEILSEVTQVQTAVAKLQAK